MTTDESATASDEGPVVTKPVVVDLGKAKRKQIKRLMAGEGPLLDNVMDCVGQIRESVGPGLEGKELVPIVFVYRRKRKRKTIFDWM